MLKIHGNFIMTSMNFNTSNDTFRQLLGNGLSYKIPAFQRDYSWTEEEWEDLWQDIIAMFDGEEPEQAHYMGYLVLQSTNQKSFDVIDGQQRITTLSVIILAGLAYIQDLVESNLDIDRNSQRKTQLLNSYIGYVDPVTLLTNPKLTLNRHNDNFYQDNLVTLKKTIPQRGFNSSEHQLRKCFEWFKKHISARFGMHEQSGQDYTVMLDQMVDKLFFTVITVTDELNAFKVFETLNARGVQLSATDLLKNYLFSIVSSESDKPQNLHRLEQKWEQIVGVLGKESFTDFIRVFWNSRYKTVRKTDLFKTIRKNITNAAQVFDLISSLDSDARIYAALRDPSDDTWNKQESKILAQLMMYRVKQPLSLLMASYNAYFDQQRDLFTKILHTLDVLSFRYNVICGLPAIDQEPIYNQLAIKVSNNTINDHHAIFEALAPIYPSDDKFKQAFSDKNLKTTNTRNGKIVRHILFSLDKQKSNAALDANSEKYNLEHILPENPEDGWDAFSDNQLERFTYRIGNMALLETSINNKLGNTAYEHKKEGYAKSHITTTQSIPNHYNQWTPQSITQRQEQLAKLAATVWKVNEFNPFIK